mmetsp:Transcript_62709/g.172228  ORF Transcript_62709/g.172228 Transcript_62709/m.172228 type:complete len:247 (+) Transcript_62709:706-1446(+)
MEQVGTLVRDPVVPVPRVRLGREEVVQIADHLCFGALRQHDALQWAGGHRRVLVPVVALRNPPVDGEFVGVCAIRRCKQGVDKVLDGRHRVLARRQQHQAAHQLCSTTGADRHANGLVQREQPRASPVKLEHAEAERRGGGAMSVAGLVEKPGSRVEPLETMSSRADHRVVLRQVAAHESVQLGARRHLAVRAVVHVDPVAKRLWRERQRPVEQRATAGSNRAPRARSLFACSVLMWSKTQRALSR